MSALRFSINYRSHRKVQFEHFLNTYAEKVDKDLVELRISPHETDSDLWEAHFLLILPQSSHAERVYEQLLLAKALSHGATGTWKVEGPFDDGQLHFECTFQTRKQYQSLRWAHLST